MAELLRPKPLGTRPTGAELDGGGVHEKPPGLAARTPTPSQWKGRRPPTELWLVCQQTLESVRGCWQHNQGMKKDLKRSRHKKEVMSDVPTYKSFKF